MLRGDSIELVEVGPGVLGRRLRGVASKGKLARLGLDALSLAQRSDLRHRARVPGELIGPRSALGHERSFELLAPMPLCDDVGARTLLNLGNPLCGAARAFDELLLRLQDPPARVLSERRVRRFEFVSKHGLFVRKTLFGDGERFDVLGPEATGFVQKLFVLRLFALCGQSSFTFERCVDLGQFVLEALNLGIAHRTGLSHLASVRRTARRKLFGVQAFAARAIGFSLSGAFGQRARVLRCIALSIGLLAREILLGQLDVRTYPFEAPRQVGGATRRLLFVGASGRQMLLHLGILMTEVGEGLFQYRKVALDPGDLLFELSLGMRLALEILFQLGDLGVFAKEVLAVGELFAREVRRRSDARLGVDVGARFPVRDFSSEPESGLRLCSFGVRD